MFIFDGMGYVEQNRKFTLKQLCLVVLVFFALMPCSVKNSFFLNQDLHSVKNLNAVKLPTAASENCTIYSTRSISTSCKEKSVKKEWDIETVQHDVVHQDFFIRTFIFLYSFSNAPPFYILYKRLKIACFSFN